MAARDAGLSAEHEPEPDAAGSPTRVGHPVVQTTAQSGPFRARMESGELGHTAASTEPDAVLATLHAVLGQLDAVAEDRIRDAKAAKSLLTALIRCVKAARKHPGAPLPTQRILHRLCYYANARDSGIRSGTFRVARYVVVSEAAAVELVHTRLMLSIVRSLEREPKYLWERVQALKLARAIVEVRPGVHEKVCVHE